MSAPTRRLLLTSIFATQTGVAEAQPYGPPGYAPIPPPRPEMMPPPPGAAYVWQPGHWVWNGRAYVWISGRYLPRRPHWHEWREGHWEMHHGRWVWIGPYWR